MKKKDQGGGLTALESDIRRAIAVLDKTLPREGNDPDRTALRAAALPVILAELLACDYRDDGPYAAQFPDYPRDAGTL